MKRVRANELRVGNPNAVDGSRCIVTRVVATFSAISQRLMYSFALVLLRPAQYPPRSFRLAPRLASFRLILHYSPLPKRSLPLLRSFPVGLRTNKFHRAYYLSRRRNPLCRGTGWCSAAAWPFDVTRRKPPKWIFVTFCRVTVAISPGCAPVFHIWDIICARNCLSKARLTARNI